MNLTAHPVVVYGGAAVLASWEASGRVARLDETTEPAPALRTEVGEIPVVRTRYAGRIKGLPAPQADTAYVVSRVLAAAHPRADVFFPWDEVRDRDGHIIGCRGLGQFAAAGGGSGA